MTGSAFGAAPGMPTFREFVLAVLGFYPYRWQEELAEAILRGHPPTRITAPTGMGKTVIVVAYVWALAMDLERCAMDTAARRRVPIRLVVAVDRRVVVDGTAAIATDLAEALANPGEDCPAVAAVARVLRDYAPDSPQPLQVTVLRGGMPERPENIRHPAAPAVIVGTIDLTGSRLLGRPYGVAPRRRAIELALAGCDALWVLDEGHIAPQFETTLSLHTGEAGARESLIGGAIPPLRAITMTATPKAGSAPFDWAAEIDTDPKVGVRRSQRRATKLNVVTVEAGSGDAGVARVVSSVSLLPGESLIVYANTPASARRLAAALRKRKDLCPAGQEVLLFIGGMPELLLQTQRARLDRVMTKARREENASPGGDPMPALVVVATQTLEVGADLDADHVVTPRASAEAITQRAGRVNRLGLRTAGSMTIVNATGAKEPVYGDRAVALGRDLDARRPNTIGELEDLLSSDEARAWRAEEQPPAVLPAHVADQYQRTAGSPHEPPVARWLRAPSDGRAEVQIVFRQSVAQISDDDELIEHLHRCPPDGAEMWTMTPDTAAEIIKERLQRATSEGARAARLVVLDLSRVRQPTVTTSSPSRLTSGDLIVLAACPDDALLGIEGLGVDFSQESPDPPFQLVPPEDTADGADDSPDEGEADETAPVDEGQSRNTLSDHLIYDGDRAEWREVVPVRTAAEAAKAAEPVTLDDHQSDVALVAERWARRLGLNDDLVADIRLAALLHDEGKRRDAVQRMMRFSVDRNGALSDLGDDTVLAKSRLPRHLWRRASRLAALPVGFRHEAASAECFDHKLHSREIAPHDPELVRHLILTHHGHFRGAAPWMDGPATPWMEGPDAPAYQDVTRAEWLTRPDEFATLLERYGPYSLALLETIVRLADWHVSGGSK
ncbi:type I-U CRISPR-associated helicase/endonuclease Cas3 [Calidifontibacter sp. DB2511S]|nr:type I-U CRISPR-associated helicase/endonuclease Cas3 [Calidifontibacter sp. DB2511S]